MTRLLVIELNDEGELCFSDSSDEFAAWELAGIATYLGILTEHLLESDLSEDNEDI